MLDQVDLDLAIDKREYKQAVSQLQARLYDMEQAVLEARLPVLVIFEGWAGTQKVETISTFTRRLDPRGFRVYPITPPRTYETHYPWLYRFWRMLPRQGQVAIFDRSWYRQMISERTGDNLSLVEWLRRCEDVVSLERLLSDDGVLVLKFWLHISRKEQQHRFHKLLGDKLTAWQVTDDDRWQNKHYDEVALVVEDLLARTDTAFAPWRLVPANNKHYARIAVLKTILATLEARLGRTAIALERSTEDESFDDSGGSFRRGKWSGAATAGLQLAGNGREHAIETPVTVVAPVVAGSPPGVLQRLDLS
ncbi:MAG TPA: hypothetical protein VFT99_19345, partial [Roseiflexaceae bacterium]|nr:hypothetical protein [Roseiflexaceae bacterium]